MPYAFARQCGKTSSGFGFPFTTLGIPQGFSPCRRRHIITVWGGRPPRRASGVRKWGHHECRSFIYSLVILSYRARAGSAGWLNLQRGSHSGDRSGTAHSGRRSWRRRPGGTGPRDRSSAVSRWGTTPLTTRARRPHHHTTLLTRAPLHPTGQHVTHPTASPCQDPVVHGTDTRSAGQRQPSTSRAHPGATFTGRDVNCCRHHSRS